MTQSTFVIETTAERFEVDVIEQSKETLVVLDFWAAWCQPCRQLGPLLERLAEEHQGRFILVKADTDQLPQHAMAFNVQGIPAVFALKNGDVVDSFTGLLTEGQLRDWLSALLPSEADLLVTEAAELEASDPAAAEAKYRQALERTANQPLAKIGLARVLLAQGKPDEVRQILEELEERGFLEPEAQRLKSQLELQGGSVSAGELDSLRARLKADPNDPQVKSQLAEALLAGGQFQEGLDLALDLVSIQQGEARDQARKRMLDAFRVLGDDSELTQDYRRRLARALY